MKHQRNRTFKYSLALLPVLFILALASGCSRARTGNANDAVASNSSNASETTSSSGYIDLVGKWEGQAGGHPSTLSINNHMGETFSGTETVGDNQIAVAGVVDLKTRAITIRETNLIKGDKAYPLGSGTGVIAPSGRQMSGEWKTKGSASSFSYSK